MWLMTPTKTRPHKPMLAEWTSEILSLSFQQPECCKGCTDGDGGGGWVYQTGLA